MTIQLSNTIRSNDVGFEVVRPGTLDKVLDTVGDGTNTYRLSRVCYSVMVFVDGVMQSNFTPPNGNNVLVMGSVVGITQQIVVYSYSDADTGTINGVATPYMVVEGYPSDIPVNPVLNGGVFAYSGLPQAHYSSDWEVYQGETLVWSSLNDPLNLTSVVVPESLLSEGTEYTFRVRYTSSMGITSEWGSVVASTVSGFVGWVATLGGSGYDAFTGVSTDTSGNVYAVGHEYSSAPANNEALITKWSADGSLLWQKRLGGGSDDSLRGVSTDSSGNVYAVGYERSSISNYEALITKWSSTGSLLWQKRIGGSGSGGDYFRGISIDSNDNIYAVGSESSSTGNNQALITKWSSTGSLVWQKRLGGAERFYGVSTDSSGNVYAVGGEGSTIIANYESLITKWSTDGSLLWQKKLGSGGTDYFYGVSTDSSGNVYAVGYELSSVPGNQEALITKWSSTGSLLWQKRIGGSGIDYFQGVSIDSNDNIYAVGSDASSVPSNYELFVSKWSTDGSLLWQKRIGGSGNSDEFQGITVDPSDNIYVVGFEGSSVSGNTGTIIVKLDPDGSIPNGALVNHPLLSVNTTTLAVNTTTLAVNTTTFTVNTTTLAVNTTTLAVNDTTLTPVKSEY